MHVVRHVERRDTEIVPELSNHRPPGLLIDAEALGRMGSESALAERKAGRPKNQAPGVSPPGTFVSTDVADVLHAHVANAARSRLDRVGLVLRRLGDYHLGRQKQARPGRR